MELALPLLALGSWFVIDRHHSTTNNNNAYSSSLVDAYPTPNQATDTYVDQTVYEQQVQRGDPEVTSTLPSISSLSGNYLDSAQFRHNNMVPFNGGKVKGHVYHTDIAESVLDNMTGSGSQVTRKWEQPPLFAPQEQMTWIYGQPNQSEFYLSRVNPSMKNNMVKPFDTVHVGPGLNQGYGLEGSAGYNAGMEARDKWMPKTVDELRVDTNPKLEYDLVGHEGPADSFIKGITTPDMLGRMEKQRPDRFYIQDQGRWLTTTGAEKGETQRPVQETGIIRRNDIPIQYMGPASNQDRQSVSAPQHFEPSKRQEPFAGSVNPSVSTAHQNVHNTMHQTHSNRENHRTTVSQPDRIRSGFSSAVGAVIAPLMDMLRPTRKEETMDQVRLYGEPTSLVPRGTVYNPYDAPPTTMKETTLYTPALQINNQGSQQQYIQTYLPPNETQRDTSSCGYYSTPGGAATGFGDMDYESAYRQHNNDIKSQTIDNRMNQGGMQLFNPQTHLSTIKSDSDRFDGRMNPAYSSMGAAPPSKDTYGALSYPQQYDQGVQCERNSSDILAAFKSNPYTHSLTTAV